MAATRKNTSADEYLKARIALAEARDAAHQREELTDRDVDDTEALERAVVNIHDKNVRRQKLHKRAEALMAIDPEKETKEQEKEDQENAEKLGKEEEKKQEEDQAKRGITLAGTTRAVGRIGDTANQAVNPLIDKVASLPTVGGIGALLLLLAILLFTVVQVNAAGDTRLKQLWYMLNGRASIVGRTTVIQGSQGATGAGTQFGTPTPTSTTPNATPTQAIGAATGTGSTLLGF